ncbi:penicillinase repressor [Longimycelium tulufanense]|uniref:Penicillinase repressor n=1 Tax=Longimycelium tulufanense TaxID=907463 RepID=A0A8J3CBS7_9PSEU|nr:BlaI/MecI/CopY family transcriptional regulator [Longimycelium tulufanense]GGM50302.1 penicillinase repressor [Longimycelium tulufanense]
MRAPGGELEAAVMEQLWAADGALTVRQVWTRLTAARPLAYTTVLTVLHNLFKKGLVRREVVGRAHAYQAVASREEHTAELMAQALAGSANRPAAFLQFVDRISAEDLDALRAALRQAERRQSQP